MADVKQLKRVATAATSSEENGTTVIKLEAGYDGGDFSIHPMRVQDGEEATLYLPDPERPGYGTAIRGNALALGNIGRAALAIERGLKGEAEPAE